MTINPTTFARLRPDLENPTEADVAEVLSQRMLLACRGWSRST